jgi:hypothetical protein
MDESAPRKDRGSWDGQDLLSEGSRERRAEAVSNSDLDQGTRVVALGLPLVPAPCLLGLVANNCGVTASPPLRADKSTNLYPQPRHGIRTQHPPGVIPRPCSLFRIVD